MSVPAYDRVMRLSTLVDRGYATPCRAFLGTKTKNGYGQVSVPQRNGVRVSPALVHRVVWEHHHGPIPPGMKVVQIDHLCRQRDCCEITHLELVTPRENQHRGEFTFANKTHCPQGHPYDEENTIRRKRGGRECRACANARDRARWPGRRHQRRRAA